jgi:hypothetical protein
VILIFWSIAQVLPTSYKYVTLWLCEVKTIFEGNLVLLYKIYRIIFLPYAVEDNIERKKTELNVVLNESLNNINKGNGDKVSSVGIIVWVSIPTVFCLFRTPFCIEILPHKQG